MSNIEFVRPIDENQLQIIYKKLGGNDDKLKNRQELFKQWIHCQEHIPKNIDQRIIDNFIRLSKFDIERAKSKFELWLYARGKYTNLYGNPFTSKRFSVHRNIIILRNLTEDGYRVLTVTFKNLDIENFDYEQYLRYCMMYGEYFLYNDINAGCVILFDMDCFNTQLLAKINVVLLKSVFDVFMKVEPQRIKQVHIANLPKLAQGLYTISRAVLPEKIKQRIFLHEDMSAVLDYIKPNNILPNEYGGKDGSLRDLADSAKEFLANDGTFNAEREKWFLAADLPTDKKKIYTFPDQGAAGSFRKLQID